MIFSYICRMVLIFTVGILFLILAVWLWIKLVFMIFRKRIKKETNPYIEAQKIINQNDKDYEEYIQWMQKNNGQIPLDKIRTAEEIRADNQLKRYKLK